eukprot:SM000225S07032  [mRNA]  locus=s225:124084:126933:- [translate_table: standard]
MDGDELAAPGGAAAGEPQQVHVSMAGEGRVRVSWLAHDRSLPSLVEYGAAPGRYDRSARGTNTSYTYLGYRSGLIHHVVLGDDSNGDSEPLAADAVYYYRCGGVGREFHFKTPPAAGPNTPITFVLLGDLGQTEWSRSTLSHIAQSEHDMLILAGDLSYADRFQPRWDTWGRLVEPLAAARPWMVTEGNHEIEDVWGLEPEFKAYNARWPTPYAECGSPSSLFYSFDVACVHFLMLGSYADFSRSSDQYRWLQADLAKVDRSRTPWLIAVLHAPWYNTNSAHQGEGDSMMAAMEDLLVDAQVDLVFAGHVHAYERFAPVAKGVMDERGPVHITIGDGGNREGLATRYLKPTPACSLRREASFGHGELEILNGQEARWTWHRNQDSEAVVADEVVFYSRASTNGTATSKGGWQVLRKLLVAAT